MATTPDQAASKKEVTYSVLAWLGATLPRQYQGMVLSRWMRSLRYGNDYYKLMEGGHYFAAYEKYIKTLLSRDDCIVRIAHLSDDHDVCLGFSVSRDKVLDYVHVQTDTRNNGIGRSLVPFTPEVVTHLTWVGMILWARKIPNAVFNPFQ